MLIVQPNHARNTTLVASARSSLDDIDAVVREHRPAVLGYAMMSLRDQDLADTITQECFLRAFRTRARFRGECSVRTWLISIAANLIRGHTRSKRFRFWKTVNATAIDICDVHDRLAGHQQSPEAQLLLREEVDRIWTSVGSLPRRQREVFLMHFIAEMELSEIACVSGAALSTVKSQLYRGIKSLRRDLMRPRVR
ncbi:sigma-70 family RNA polymerase sigma factor [Granulicella sp. S156]|uniref:RNA polymerase sigma factor n=1 Tax=Granulicella sp. S156 TaxID=1747224 RepID=UPI00131C5514|nr:sigma-70 family RNA polymerase sigma factor [Granulicella sp. S156]